MISIAGFLAVAFVAIAFGMFVWLVKNYADWMARFGRVSEERDDLLMAPVIEADIKRREARRAAGIPDPDYIITVDPHSPLFDFTTTAVKSFTTTTTHKPRKRRWFRREVY